MLNSAHPARHHTSKIVTLSCLVAILGQAILSAQSFNFGRHKQVPASQDQSSAQSNKAVTQSTSAETPPPQSTPAKPSTPSKQPEADKGERQPIKLLHRQDFSGQFSYILPENWRAHQIPFQTHDVLSLRENDKTVATISFSDQIGKKNLSQVKSAIEDSDKKDMDKFELKESQLTTLQNGAPCAKIVGLAKLDETSTRLVQYVIPFKKKHFMLVTLTVSQTAGEKYDKLLDEVISSITTDKTVIQKK